MFILNLSVLENVPLEKLSDHTNHHFGQHFRSTIEKKVKRKKKDYSMDNAREVDYISGRVTNSIQPGSKAAFNEPIARS